jgi:dTDP-4-dehydrorhamnose reductase
MDILVTGANGQLANIIKRVVESSRNTNNSNFTFVSREDFNIVDQEAVSAYFSNHKVDAVINCAAYTKVDLAEDEQEMAYDVNVNAVKYLAIAAESCGAEFYHVSTDFVFNGETSSHYKESHNTNPISVYGKTKLEGENAALEFCSKTQIIRTSWLYSDIANNFVKTIIRLASSRTELTVVADQIGTPTSAENLANAILNMLSSENKHYGEVYHYSDAGECSWCEFAQEIVRLKALNCDIKPIPSEDYPQKATRPKYSVMNKEKIVEYYSVVIFDWKLSLAKVIEKL